MRLFPPFLSSFISSQPSTIQKCIMEEENQKGMSKKEANKYLSFLIKEWSKAENEVR